MNVSAPSDQDPRPALLRVVWGLMAAALVVAVVYSGLPSLDAPWIQGDEHRFIVNNPDVTGDGRAESLTKRCLDVFFHYHDDLYQPIPILTYAVEWELWGAQRVPAMRFTDVALHAANGLLLWVVLVVLFRVFTGKPTTPTSVLVGYSLALLWCLHPIEVSAYAADMGRTHLLSALFALLSLLAHVSYLQRRDAWRIATAFVLLLLAMLSKPIVGWAALIFMIEWRLLGWRAALRSWRVYATLALGLFFAVVTLDATSRAAMLEDASILLFGDPLSRSCFAVWLYVVNTLNPSGLCSWYPPDPRSVWSHPAVIVGLVIAALSVAVGLAAVLREKTRGVAAGVLWCWALLLPVIGLVGARVASANDRYVYQPLMGVALAVGVALLLAFNRLRPQHALRLAVALTCVAMGLGVLAVPLNRHFCDMARSTLKRADRIVESHPDHPRTWELLAKAYQFASERDSVERRTLGSAELLRRRREALDHTVALAEASPQFFTTDHDRAAFHRRMAFEFLAIGDPAESCRHALAAHAIEPDSVSTWTNLAQAFKAIGRYEEADAAYSRLVDMLRRSGNSIETQYLHNRLVEWADLLLHHLNRAKDAIPLYEEALKLTPTEDVDKRRIATVNLALAEVRGGLGQTGYEIIAGYLKVNPNDVTALLVLGEYHLRSHHWAEAEATYARIVNVEPAHYRAVRGLYEIYVNNMRLQEATELWGRAMLASEQEGLTENLRASRAFFVWCAACSDNPNAARAAEILLNDEPQSPFGCFARSLIAIRNNDVEEAVRWAQRARPEAGVADGREFERAAKAIAMMEAHDLLPPSSLGVAAAIWSAYGIPAEAERLLGLWREKAPDEAPLIGKIRDQIKSSGPLPHGR